MTQMSIHNQVVMSEHLLVLCTSMKGGLDHTGLKLCFLSDFSMNQFGQNFHFFHFPFFVIFI